MSLHNEKPQIPGYEIIEKIGEGGMANVYMARQVRLDRVIAIKVLKFGLAEDAEEDRKRFRIEAQSAAQISHPNLVQIIDFGEHGGQTYIIMEYVPGCTVGDLLELRHAINEKDAYAICSELTYALDHCWNQHRMIHCDIKPDNVIVHTDGTIKLADLGLARVKGFKTVDLDDDSVLGTPNYISPEQALDEEELDCRADIYSLGAMLYQMLTGLIPFSSFEPEKVVQKQLDDQLTDPWEINQTIPPSFIWVMEKMMAKDRNLRQASWKEVSEDLETAMRGCLIDQPLEAEGLSTIGRHADRPQPEKQRKRVRPTNPAAKPESLSQQERPKRKILISDEDKRQIDRQHYQQMRNDMPRSLTFLGAALILLFMLYGYSMVTSGTGPVQLQAALPAAPTAPSSSTRAIHNPSGSVLNQIELNSIEEKQHTDALLNEVKQRLRPTRPGPPPPRPKSPQQFSGNQPEVPGAQIPVGPAPVTPFSRPSDTTTAQTAPAVPTQQPPPRATTTDPKTWDSPEYKNARLKIIDSRKAFYFYVQNRGETGRLKKIEEDVREAIAALKTVQATAPAGVDVDRHISSGYKLIADCHAATQL